MTNFVSHEETRRQAMTFLEWIERSGMRAVRVAELLGISPGHLHDLTHGRTWPNRDMALRIRTLTRGAVTPNDFLPPETPPQKKRKMPRKKAARPLQVWRLNVRRVGGAEPCP